VTPFVKIIKNGLAPAALRYCGVLGPLLIAVAIGTTVFAVKQGMELAKPVPIPQISIKREYLMPERVASIVARFSHDNPGVLVEQSKDGKTIIIKNTVAGAYFDFIYALSTTPGLEKGVFWESKVLCLNDCLGKTAVFAEIRGFTQSIDQF